MSNAIKKLVASTLLSLGVSCFVACGGPEEFDPADEIDDTEQSTPSAQPTSNKKLQAPRAPAPPRPIERLQADDSQQDSVAARKRP